MIDKLRPLALLAFGLVFVLGGCSEKGPPFVAAYGPHIKPLPIACPHPVPAKAGYIFTPVQVTPMWNGDWLVADGGEFNGQGAKVVMFSPKGKPLWVVTGGSMNFVHSAYLTTRGNILISDTGNNRVIEVDPADCKVVFNTDDLGPGHGFLGRGRLNNGAQLLYPNDAKEIPNGHYLISSRLTNTVYEINREGHIYWQCSKFLNLQGKPDGLSGQHNPQRLPNEDTIISDSDNGRVVIVNPSCTRMVWEYTGRGVKVPVVGGLKNGSKTLRCHKPAPGTNYCIEHPYGDKPLEWPRDATKMPNGDILIDDSIHNRCLEVNRKHQIVREYYDLPEPYSCWPMQNGLVATGDTQTHGIAIFAPGSPQAELKGLIPAHPVKNPFGKPPSHLVNGSFETES